MITRLWPLRLSVQPTETLSVLFLNQGFTPIEFFSVCRDAVMKVVETSPFDRTSITGQYQDAIAWFIADAKDAALNLTVNGTELVSSVDAGTTLLAYLAGAKVACDDASTVAAGDVWPQDGRYGTFGSLVIVLVKDTRAAELYTLATSPSSPVPMIGVTVQGTLWHQLIVRGLAQMLGELDDEYELDGPEHSTHDNQEFSPFCKNVLFLSQDQRDAIASGTPPLKVVTCASLAWRLPYDTPVEFHAHQGDTPNGPIDWPKDWTKRQMYEGGGGYRHNTMRSSPDCLMRRRPGDPTLPVQADVHLCDVCHGIVEMVIGGVYRHAPLSPSTVTLGDQRPHFDRIAWKRIDTIDLATTKFPLTITGADPRNVAWEIQVAADPASGLQLSNIKLTGRAAVFDTFAAAENVLESIQFKDLIVALANGTTIPLKWADAFAGDPRDKADPKPVLTIGYDGGNWEWLVGVKLTLTWHIDGVTAIEASLSAAFRATFPDFDPGSGVMARRFYPQIAMRYLRLPRRCVSTAKATAKIASLQGTVSCVANNTIPTSLKGTLGMLDSMATGKQVVGVFTDSNTSDFDNKYSFSAFAWGIGGDEAKAVGFQPPYRATWSSGRWLAGMNSLAGSTARRAHLVVTDYKGTPDGRVPGLPHWSWLFDNAYVDPPLRTRRDFVGVYGPGRGPAGTTDASRRRELLSQWPESDVQTTPRDTKMRIVHLPRQGSYDNIHISAYMGEDNRWNTDPAPLIVPAPFCGDMCMHLHWRWGLMSLTGGGRRIAYYGWGDGRLGHGSHRVPGAPLIPPNQHLTIGFIRPDEGRIQVDYKVEAISPRLGEWQVILEQGLAIAFQYATTAIGGGFRPMDVGLLAAATGAAGMTDIFTIAHSIDIPDNGPADLNLGWHDIDPKLRMIFMSIYPRLRHFDPKDDGVVSDHAIQQVPTDPKAENL